MKNDLGFIEPITLNDEEKQAMQTELTQINAVLIAESKLREFESIRKFHAHFAKAKYEGLSDTLKGMIGKLTEINALVLRAYSLEAMNLVNKFYRVNRNRLPALDKEDYFQQACFAIYQAIIEYDNEKSKMSTYVYHSVNRSLLNFVRSRRKDISVPICSIEDTKHTLVEKMSNVDRIGLMKAIEQADLKPLERDVVTAYLMNDRKYRGSVVNPTTGEMYTRSRVNQFFKSACEKIRLVMDSEAYCEAA